MSADPDLTMSAPGGQLRMLARRLGVAGFWTWWLAQLAALVPAAPRAALQRSRMRPVLAFDTATATLWKPAARGGELRMVEAGSIPLEGDPATVAGNGRAALAPSTRSTRGTFNVVVTLPMRSVLRKRLTLPEAVEEHLHQMLRYDLDRHTPFKPDEMYFDAAVVDRDPGRGTVDVDLAAARRTVVDAALRHAQAWGATVVGVSPEPPAAASTSTLNLLPPELWPSTSPWRRWQVWLPIALLLLLAMVTVVLPLLQKREYAIALSRLEDEARTRAAVSENLRSELDRLVGDFNFALERKYGYPSVVQVLDDVTRMLPDDTWLTQFEIKTLRGKDTQRELSLRGESVNAGRLVTLLEDSKLVSQAAPRSPTTKIQPGPGEIFDVGGQLRPLPLPAQVALVIADSGVPPTADRPPAPHPAGGATAPAPAAGGTVNPGAPTGPAAAQTTLNATPAQPASSGGSSTTKATAPNATPSAPGSQTATTPGTPVPAPSNARPPAMFAPPATPPPSNPPAQTGPLGTTAGPPRIVDATPPTVAAPRDAAPSSKARP